MQCISECCEACNKLIICLDQQNLANGLDNALTSTLLVSGALSCDNSKLLGQRVRNILRISINLPPLNTKVGFTKWNMAQSTVDSFHLRRRGILWFRFQLFRRSRGPSSIIVICNRFNWKLRACHTQTGCLFFCSLRIAKRWSGKTFVSIILRVHSSEQHEKHATLVSTQHHAPDAENFSLFFLLCAIYVSDKSKREWL